MADDIVERLRLIDPEAEALGVPELQRRLWDAADEIERLRIDTVPKSWDGLLTILDEVYPADIFDGSSGDPGPRIVVLLRQINGIRASVKAPVR